MDREQIISQYRKWAIVHGESDNSRKANRAFDKLTALTRRMFEAGPETAQVIITLLDDENIHVRYNAAFDTLSLDPDVALSVLRDLAEGQSGMMRFEAQDTLKFWNAGTLELPGWKKLDWNKPSWQGREK